jgi:hypothetical protein
MRLVEVELLLQEAPMLFGVAFNLAHYSSRTSADFL